MEVGENRFSKTAGSESAKQTSKHEKIGRTLEVKCINIEPYTVHPYYFSCSGNLLEVARLSLLLRYGFGKPSSVAEHVQYISWNLLQLYRIGCTCMLVNINRILIDSVRRINTCYYTS